MVHSPEMSESEDEGRSFKGDAVAPSEPMDESDEDRGWVDEDDVGSGGESLVIRATRHSFG
jgi:hypothetical protein